MFRNKVVALSSVWLLVAPTLCAAGVLKHACDCSSERGDCEPCCAGGGPGCGCAGDGCSHDTCANDPCQVAIAVDTRGSVQLDFATAFAALEDFEWDSALLGPDLAGTSDPRGARKNLPYHLSDIPLLV